MRKEKKLINVICFIIIFIILNSLLKWILIPAPAGNVSRWNLHGASSEEYDLVFVGSSEVMRSCNPQIIDEELGIRSYNSGTFASIIGGGIDASVYNLYKNYTPSKLVLMIGTNAMIGEEDESAETFALIYPALSDGYARWKYIKLTMMQSGEFYRIFTWAIPNLGKVREVVSTIEQKTSREYRDYDIDYLKESINERGWIKGHISLVDNMSFDDLNTRELKNKKGIFENKDCELLTKKINALTEMISYAKGKGSEVYVVMQPIPVTKIYSSGSYFSYTTQVKSLVESCGAKYIDTNLMKKSVYRTESDEFYDSSHLNAKGANNYSKEIADLIMKLDSNEDISDLFYKSWDEYVDSIDSVVATRLLLKEKDGKKVVEAHGVCGHLDNVEYRFVILNNNDEHIIDIQNYNLNNKVVIPEQYYTGHYKIRVYSKTIEMDEKKARYDTKIIN